MRSLVRTVYLSDQTYMRHKRTHSRTGNRTCKAAGRTRSSYPDWVAAGGLAIRREAPVERHKNFMRHQGTRGWPVRRAICELETA